MAEWVAAAPKDADARFQLGTLLFEMDRFADAERTLRAAVAFGVAPASGSMRGFSADRVGPGRGLRGGLSKPRDTSGRGDRRRGAALRRLSPRFNAA